MSREIKFRFYGGEFLGMSNPMTLEEIANMDTGITGMTPCQFTGLKDKNGKDIYEGDIVMDTYFTDAVGKVEWMDQGARFSPFFDESTLYFCDIDTTAVIGNIYENKDFLEKT